MASSSRTYRRTRPVVARVCLQSLSSNPRDHQLLEEFCNLTHRDDCWSVDAFWEDEYSHLEVRHSNEEPIVRVYSEDRKLSLCRHFWNCHRGAHCYYAHTVKELLTWKDQRLGQGQHSESSWPELRLPSAMVPTSVLLEAPNFEAREYSSATSTSSYGRRAMPISQRSHTKVSRTEQVMSHSRRYFEEANMEVIAEDLSTHNYKKKFEALLRSEQKAREEKLHKICNGTFSFHKIREQEIPFPGSSEKFTSYGYIDGMSGDAINYGSRESAGVLVESNMMGSVLSCNLKNVDNKLYLGFKNNYDIDNKKISLKFLYKDSYFDNLSKMVSKLNEHMISRILPKQHDFSWEHKVVDTSHYCKNLSCEQTAAFKAIVSKGKNMPPVLLTGAFGCGKTHVLAKSAVYFLNEDSDFKEPRILVCTQQNVSANNFLKLFHEIQIKKDPDLYLVRVTPFNYTAHDQNLDRSEFKRVDELTRRNFGTKKKVLVITTCSTSFTALKNSVFPEEYFTHVLLDECAQMREPEAIAPLCLAARDAKLVMAGDFKQVGPSSLVIGDLARQNGFAVSLVERLYTLYKRMENATNNFFCELRENHRCHKEIVKFCGHCFYDDLSMSSAVVSSEPKFPLEFICSDLELRIDLSNHSRVYEDEAEVMVQQLANVYECWPKDTWGQEKDCSQIVIAASTRGQLAEIERKLKDYSRDLMKTRRVPTDDIQGKEYRVVIIGTSEPTQESGQPLSMTDSICNPQVFNTVISRARSRVIVVGNPFALLCKEKCIHGDKEGFWESYLKKCLEHGTFNSEHVKRKAPRIHGLLMEALKAILQSGSQQVSSQTKANENDNNNKDPNSN